LRLAYPRHSAKAIARDFNIAVVTAKHWLRWGFPTGRRAEVAAVVEARLEEQAADILETIKFIREGLHEESSAAARARHRVHSRGAAKTRAADREVGSG
jgi:hypothetical protein